MADGEALLLRRHEAAARLGMSLRHFDVGQLRQYRPRDLERWVEQSVTTR